jgi:asparagine synthase (glutamine-hydrolysing)
MTVALQHRGPDGNGLFLKPGIALGHARLSIIDLDGGDQPMHSESGRFTIVFNGEIYNYKELRSDLRASGVAFRTQSDTEVILCLYERHGSSCLEYLNGMFAFAIWDNDKKSLFLARDRMGEKPLYYCVQNGSLFFASELKALLGALPSEPTLNFEALDDYLCYGYVPTPRTIYSDIFKLPSASSMLWRRGEHKVSRYWSSEIVPRLGDMTIEEAEENLYQLLLDSVALRLRADVPVGTFLSGGVDSSLITMMAAQQSPKKISSFTIAFNESTHDESQYARTVAERAGTDHNEILVSDLSLNILPDLVRQFDEPFADPSSLPTYYVCRAAAGQLKVCLSGDAGDEVFGGYRRYRREPLERVVDFLPKGLTRSLTRLVSRSYPSHWTGQGWLTRLGSRGAERYQMINGVFPAAERRDLFRPEFQSYVEPTVWSYAGIYERHTNLPEAAIRQQVDQKTYLSDDILVKVDRMSMLSSLEVRVPLLDHRIIEFANALPLEYKIDLPAQKVLLRRVASRLLPREFLSRSKRGFGLPLQSWFRESDGLEMAEAIGQGSSPLADYLLPAEISKLVSKHRSGFRDYGARIWALLCLDIWMRADTAKVLDPSVDR